MPNRPMILIVEDDPDIREVLAAFLEERGYRPVEATDEEVGAEILETKPPDLLITDVLLRAGSGLRLADVARTLGIPALLMSGAPSAIERWQRGPLPFLEKPFGLARLERAIAALLPFRTVRPAGDAYLDLLAREQERLHAYDSRIARQLAVVERLRDGGASHEAEVALAKMLLATMEVSRRVARDTLRVRAADAARPLGPLSNRNSPALPSRA